MCIIKGIAVAADLTWMALTTCGACVIICRLASLDSPWHKWMEIPMTLCWTLGVHGDFLLQRNQLFLFCVWDLPTWRCSLDALGLQKVLLFRGRAKMEGERWWKRTSCTAGSSPEVQRAYIKPWVIAAAPSSPLASALSRRCDHFEAIPPLFPSSAVVEKRCRWFRRLSLF